MNRPNVYLDTARIGQMTIGAKQACDAAQLIARDNPRVLFQEILEPTGKLIPHWNGIPELQYQLKNLFDAGDFSEDIPHPLHLMAASNSAVLMKLVARSIFSVGRRLMVTDLVWRNHLRLLQLEARRTNNEIIVVPLRQHLVNPDFSANGIADFVSDTFISQQCDSLFLTAVSSDGIRLPIDLILSGIDHESMVRQVFVDGAQEFAQGTECQFNKQIDGYLFSAHKWLGSSHPLSLMAYGNRRSASQIQRTLDRLIQSAEIDDPMIKFWISQVCPGSGRRDETVNVLPLIAFAGSLRDFERFQPQSNLRKQNIERIRDLLDDRIWRFRSQYLHRSSQTGIEIVTRKRQRNRRENQAELQLSANGIEATVCDVNSIRLSFPISKISQTDSAIIANAFDCI